MLSGEQSSHAGGCFAQKEEHTRVIRNMPILDELVVPATIIKKTLHLAVPHYTEPGWTVLSAGT